MNKQPVIIFILIILFTLQGCSRYSIKAPSGFAELKKGDSEYFYSPDGVKIKISVFPNKPEKNTEFWADALKNHLMKKGYRHYKSADNEMSGITEYWIIAYGNEYYLYMTSVHSGKKYIAAVEAAGEKKLIEKYRSVIDESLSTIKVR